MPASVEKQIYKCGYVKKKVSLDVKVTKEKGLLGSKVTEQKVLKCDLQAMGGCNMHPERFDTKCPAVAQAVKCALK